MTGEFNKNKNENKNVVVNERNRKQVYQIVSRKDFMQLSKFLLFCTDSEKNTIILNQKELILFMQKQSWDKGLNLLQSCLKRWAKDSK